MWPFNKKKGIKIAPGESMAMEFLTQWRNDKKEVVIMTKEGPILLNEKSELFISLQADNMDPVKIQVVPDFKNKMLKFVEIIDPNAPKKFTDANSPKFVIARGMASERRLTLSDILKDWDNDIEKFEKNVKNYRRIRNIFMPLNTLLAFYNIYLFVTSTNTARYINLIVGIFSIFVVIFLWITDKKYHDELKEYKEMRENAFGIVKDK